MNEQLHPLFKSILERQFAEVFPISTCKDRLQVDPWPHGYCPECGADRVPPYCTHPKCPTLPKDRLAELQSQLHVKGEQV